MEYDNTNKGALWDNLNKKSSTHPDFRGKLNVNGDEYWVSCWRRRDGAKVTSPVLSLSIEKIQAKQTLPQSKKPSNDAFSDDIPF